MGRHVTDSELARAIESSPFHQQMLQHPTSYAARVEGEFEELAKELGELNSELIEERFEDDEPTVLYHRVGDDNWFRN